MIVLTLTAPWSWLAALRLKMLETRSWAAKHRGLLGIHTGISLDPVGGPKGLLDLCARPYFKEAMEQLGITDPLAVPRGRIIAVVNLADCRRIVASAAEHVADPKGTILPPPYPERAFGDYTPGRYAWTLDGATMLSKPIVTPGRQRLWYWTSPIQARQIKEKVTRV
jgi:hypothetical protein